MLTLIIRSFWIIICAVGIANAAQISLPVDSEGWTVFTPSADSVIVYVSATGSDVSGVAYVAGTHPHFSTPFDETGISAFATIAEAATHLRSGYPDWLLIKRGDTFYESVVSKQLRGRSVAEPSLVAGYGTGPSPVLKAGTGYGIRFYDNSASYRAVSGLDFYAHTRDPDGAEFVDTTGTEGVFIYASTNTGYPFTIEGILIEGCKFRFFAQGVNMVCGNGTATGITFRRNSITDSYNTAGHSQGIGGSVLSDVILEENIFDHNGWYADNGSGGYGEATVFNHNVYLTNVSGLKIRNNVNMRASSIAHKTKGYQPSDTVGYEANNNLILGGEIAFSVGANDVHEPYANYEAQVNDNVFIYPGYPNPTGRGVAFMFFNHDLDGGDFSNNYMLHWDGESTNNQFWWTANTQRNVDVRNNVIYGTMTNYLNIVYASEDLVNGYTGNVIADNKYATLGTRPIVRDARSVRGGFTYSDNYYSTEAPTGAWFILNGVNTSNDNWIAETGDNSTMGAFQGFPDPTRSIETYMTSIGETATIDAFIAGCRAQDRYSWDTRYTAEVVNAYIKAGFNLSHTAIRPGTLYLPTGGGRFISR